MTSRNFRSMFWILSLSADMFFVSDKARRTEAKIRRDVLEGGRPEGARSWMVVWISSSTLPIPAYQREGCLLKRITDGPFQILDVRLPCHELPLVILLLVDDARDGEEELPDLSAEALVTFAILLDSLPRRMSGSKMMQSPSRTSSSSQILEASSAADLRFSPTTGMKPRVLERISNTCRD
jgi:hypothetical protein